MQDQLKLKPHIDIKKFTDTGFLLILPMEMLRKLVLLIEMKT